MRLLPHRTPHPAVLAAVVAASLLASVLVLSVAGGRADATNLSLCGNPGPAPTIKHVLVVMLENESKGQVIGNAKAPYVNGTLAAQCPSAALMFAATHWSAANYLALTAGQYPANSPAGCGTVATCSTGADNVFSQLENSDQSWTAYEESMPSACNPSTSSGYYKLGHNPPPFYTNLAATCEQYDVPVADLTAQSGALWDDLQNRTLPSFAFVTPNTVHDGQDGGTNGVPAIDNFLSSFVPLVHGSASYQTGDTALLVTFDEGSGSDATKGQNCTDQSLDMAGKQESCHVAFFAVYPYGTPGEVSGFFTHYSVTRTIEELFGLPLLAGAQTAASLVGPFLTAREPTPTPSPSPSPSPTVTSTAPPTDYVANKGFEVDGKTGWTGVYTANSVTTVVTGTSYTGTHALRIANSASTAKNAGVTSKPPVIASSIAGTALSGSVWAKASVAGQKVALVVWETKSDGTGVASQSTTVTLSDTSWHLISASTPYVVRQTGNRVNMTLYATRLAPGRYLYADVFGLTS